MRVFLFTVIIITFVVFPWWVGILCSMAYAYRFHAYELIPLGIFLDAFFAPSYGELTIVYIGSLLLVVGALEFVKPFLSFYEETA